jgi:glycosyltransferase involved in cell wall biosynthesis
LRVAAREWMNVGVYIGDASPETGGGYTFVHDVLREIERPSVSAQHRFTIVTTSASTTDGSTLDVLSLAPALRDLPTRARVRLSRSVDRFLGRAPAPSDWSRPAVDRLLADARIDVMWYLQPATCWSLNVPFVTVVWDLQHRLQPYFPEVTAGNQGFIRDDVYRSLLPRASLVIAGTDAGRDEIVRFYGVAPERIRILPHPTPSFALAAAAGPGGSRPASAPAGEYLYYPAQFWPHKNHVNLLEALGILRQRHGLPLTLALSGADHGNLAFVKEAADRVGVADAVRWLGFLSRQDLVGMYRHALALTYVTFFGPENLPPLEAFALGCPVVASDVSGAREQLGDAALLVDPRDPEQIAAAVQRLHGQPAERALLVERGHARARRFTSGDFVAGVVAWLDEFAPIRSCWPSGPTSPKG